MDKKKVWRSGWMALIVALIVLMVSPEPVYAKCGFWQFLVGGDCFSTLNGQIQDGMSERVDSEQSGETERVQIEQVQMTERVQIEQGEMTERVHSDNARMGMEAQAAVNLESLRQMGELSKEQARQMGNAFIALSDRDQAIAIAEIQEAQRSAALMLQEQSRIAQRGITASSEVRMTELWVGLLSSLLKVGVVLVSIWILSGVASGLISRQRILRGAPRSRPQPRVDGQVDADFYVVNQGAHSRSEIERSVW